MEQLSEIYKKQDRLADAIAELQALVRRNDNDFDSLKQIGPMVGGSGSD